MSEDILRALLPDDFFVSLEKTRQKRAEAVAALLCDGRLIEGSTPQSDWPELDFSPRVGAALLEHRLRSAAFYAEKQEKYKFAELCSSETRLDGFELTEGSFEAAVTCCNLAIEAPFIGASPAYLIGSDTVNAPTQNLLQAAERALADVRTSRGGTTLDSMGVLVLLRRHEPLEISRSWTTSTIPGTVYSDWSSEPYILGCALIHEVGHLWLNDVFRLVGFPSDTASFPSPWKGEMRPRFYFIHSIFAFSLVSIYCAEMLDRNSDSPSCNFLERMRNRESARLAQAAAYLDNALDGIDTKIASVIQELLHATGIL